MAEYVELQCDGLVGLTHNYAGLSHGNVASASNALSISSPKKAALQGLEKMRFVASLGIPQMVLPPHHRPNLGLLRQLGFSGSVQEMLDSAYRADPKTLFAAWSASGMWAANMATVSPALDTADGTLHFTPANLASTLHRQQEAAFSQRVLERIFGGIAAVHAPLPACAPLTDEGAANHLRLSAGHGEVGVEVFVYGEAEQQKQYPVRQKRAACEAIIRLHGLKNAVLVQQHPEAIDAGVFHNDVIAMSNENLLIYHEKAFLNEAAFLAELREKFPALHAIRLTEEELPMQAAVASYFFNSQLLSLPGGGMAVIAPSESAEILQAKAVFDRLENDPSIPIQKVHHLNLRESMRNGGGPACLRLRVALAEGQLAGLPQTVMYSPQLHARLEAWIEEYYPEQLAPEGLRDAALAESCQKAYGELEGILDLPELYSGRT